MYPVAVTGPVHVLTIPPPKTHAASVATATLGLFLYFKNVFIQDFNEDLKNEFYARPH